MWAILITTVVTSASLNPALPPPSQELVPPRYETLQDCMDDEKFYGAYGLHGRSWTVPYTYDRKTQCIWVGDK